MPSLDPDDFDMQLLPHTFQCGAFSCGNPSIDHDLRTELPSRIKDWTTKAYYIDYYGSFIAFICLKVDQVEIDVIDNEGREIPLKGSKIPAIMLEMAGVDVKYQGIGIGERMVVEATAIAQEVAERVGARFLVLESVPRAKKLYERLGFIVSPVQLSRNTIFMFLDLLENAATDTVDTVV